MILTNSKRKNINVDRLIDDFILSEQSEKFLIVVPTNRKVRQLKKLLISQAPKKIISAINIETLWTLATKIYKCKSDYIKLESPAANVFINQCYKGIKPKSFARYNDYLPFGVQESIKNFFSKLKENGIYPEEFEKQLSNIKISFREKAEDLLNIYKLYIEKTSKLNLLEIGDVFHSLKNFSSSDILKFFNEIFPDVQIVFFLGFDFLNIPEIEFISRISKENSLEIIFRFDYNKYNPKIFGYLIETYIQLQKIGLAHAAEAQPEITAFKKHIVNYLFTKKNFNRKFNFENVQEIISFNRQQEIEFIAKKIKILLLEEKVKPTQICVVFNQIKNYSTLVRDIFDEYGIPLNMTDRFLLIQTAPVSVIINLLEILENNFNLQSIQKAMFSKLIKHDIDINNLINFSRYFKITSNFNRWINKINAIKSENISDSVGFDVEKLEKDLIWIKDLLKNFEKKLSKNEVLKELDNFLINLELVPSVLKLESSVAEINIRAIETFYEKISVMFNLLEDENPGSLYNLNSVLDILRNIANNTRFNVKETSGENVLVTSVDEIRGLEFDYLFLGGLCSNDFPSKYNSDLLNFHSDEVMRIKQLQKERYRFYQAITAWRKKLFLSYPQFDGEYEFVKSNFLVELEEIIDIKEFDYSLFDERIFVATDEQKLLGVYSNQELSLPLKINDEQKSSFKRKIEINQTKTLNINSEFDGYLLSKTFGNDEKEISLTNELLLTRKLKQYSASELEMFSRCPFQYFLQRVLNIYEEKEPTEFLESIELGNYLHKIFFRFFLELRKRKIILRNCSDTDFEIAKNLIFQIAVQQIPKELLNSPFAFYDIEKIFGLNNNSEDSILFRLIQYERVNNDFNPRYFEVSFGEIKQEKDEELSTNSAINFEDILLKGKIDRIDINENKFCVVDYKLSGKKPSYNDISDGIALQLPIYAFAAEVLLNGKFNRQFELDSMKIFSLKYVEDSFKLINYNSEKKIDNQELVEIALNKIKLNVEKILKGEFPLTQVENFNERVCKFCDYSSVCRVNEIR